jgi:hypothetical protein
MKDKLPKELIDQLNATDKRHGFPQGTMLSVMQQEIGGRSEFLQDPTKYHYEPNEKGQRIAKHTGKVSTAFGPFGILESTAKDPGYGVTPLRDKSLGEQVRFAGEYLAARAKQGGSLIKGLAGYGEGDKYAHQVAKRQGSIEVAAPGSGPMSEPAPAQPVQVAVAEPVADPGPAPVFTLPQTQQAEVTQAGVDPWTAFLQRVNEVKPQDLQYGKSAEPEELIPQIKRPKFDVGPVGTQANFSLFSALKGFA